MPTWPLLESVDAVTVPVPDLEAGLAFYRDQLGQQLVWRDDRLGQAGLRLAGGATEIVLSTGLGYEPDWKVASADQAAEVFRTRGGRVLTEPSDIPIGRLAVVEDPFGNRLVLLDSTKGTYMTDASGNVTGVAKEPTVPALVETCSEGVSGGEVPRRFQGTVRPAGEPDRAWVRSVLVQRWGSTGVVSRGRRYHADRLPALVAEDDGGRCGLATYRTEGAETELVTLDALRPREGVGSVLLAHVAEVARATGCHRLWLITTNDNLDAMRFYQRRGLRITAVFPGAVDEARVLKPEIPPVGEYGIPVHDEIELSLDLT